MRRRWLTGQLLVLLLIGVLGVFLIWPIVLTVRGAFVDGQGRFSVQAFALVTEDALQRRALVVSTLIAVCTTSLAIVLALPLAVLSARCTFWGKKVFNALILVPLVLPPFVGAIGMRHMLGRAGALNSLLGTNLDVLGAGAFVGVVIVEALHLYPIIYLNVVSALANVDPALDEAARNLGAGPWRRFLRVTLPLIRPGLFAGSTIVFIWSFTELGTPLMFEMRQVLPVQIFYKLKEIEGSSQPYALTVIMLAAAMLFYIVGKAIFGREGHAMYAKASLQSVERPLTGWRGALASSLFLVVVVLAALPHLGVIAASFSGVGSWYQSVLPTRWTTEHYESALSHGLAMRSISNSLKYAVIAMFVTMLVGTAIAYLNVRTKAMGRQLLDALAMLPLAVPGLVLAFGYVAMTLHAPFNWSSESAVDWQRLFLPVARQFDVLGANANPLILLVIAYSVRRLPYMTRAVGAGLEQTPIELEQAARNLGAGPLRAIRSVTLPLITANLVAGGLLVFAFSMLEVSDSLILAQREIHFPMTKAIYSLYQRLGDGEYIASAMGVWGMLLLIVTLCGASIMMGRRAGALFRA